MALLAAGTCVGYVENPYEMEGRKGISRRLTVSTGDTTEVISIPQDLADDLGPADLVKLSQFGRPVICKVTAQANKNDRGDVRLGVKLLDVQFCRLADLATYGYEASVYVEEPEPTSSKSSSSNGASTPVPA